MMKPLLFLLPVGVFALAASGSVFLARKDAPAPVRQITAGPAPANIKPAARTPRATVLTGSAAMKGWESDAPGVRRRITVGDLPEPGATPSVDNGAHGIPKPDNAWPVAPAGFKVERFASGLDNPRKIVTAPNGDLFVAESGPGRVKILRAKDGAGAVETTSVFAEGLHQPFGIAFYPTGPNPKYVYIANTGSVVRFPYHNGDLKATGPEESVVPDISAGGRLRGGGHWTRDLAFSQDNAKMFVSVGSRSNNDDSDDEYHRANILQFNPDGSGFRIYAAGIRNPVGIAIQPKYGTLWTSVNERDTLGDHLVPDYVTHVEDNGFYGWPWWYIGPHADPRYHGKHPELQDKAIVPDVLLQAHSASLCLTFYTGRQFPAMYRGAIFAAEHGSWNRSNRTGYKVIMVPVGANGKATGEYMDFLTGFVASGDGRPDGVWGRPVGVTVAHDGALMVTDDGSNSVWRVSYTRK